MATPSINDLVRYINRRLRGADWNTNFQKIVDWFTDGNTDINLNSITTTNDINVGGDVIVVGDVTADKFIGDGSEITNLDVYRKNFIINGICSIDNNGIQSLVKDVYVESVDRFEGMATGTAVTAGQLKHIDDFSDIRTGFGVEFNQVTITGTGELYLRYRLYNKDALNFKDSIGSFSMQVLHNVGSSIPYTIFINKADSKNNFSSVTAVTDSGALGVVSGTTTQLKLENISMGDVTNGLEILIKVECGAITLKDITFGELQLELGTLVTQFEYKTFEENAAHNNQDKITGKTDILDDEAVTEDNLAQNASYKSAVTRYYSVSFVSFQPFQNASTTVDYQYYDDATRIMYVDLLIAASKPHFAEVNLPHDATVTKVTMYYYTDTTGAGNFEFKRANTTGVYSTMASGSMVSNSGNASVIDSSITDALIDNQNYNYFLEVDLTGGPNPDDQRIYMFTIEYTIDKPLP